MPSTNLSVTGAGLVTSLGFDVHASCAAIRAGVRRPRPIPEEKVLDLSSGEAIPLTGHPIPALTDGFVSTARWLQMLPHALANLQQVGKLPPADDDAFWGAALLWVLLPDVEGDRFEFSERAWSSELPRTLRAPLLRMLPQALPPARVQLMPLGKTGLPSVLETAAERLHAQSARHLIILATDSMCDPFSLEWLGRTRRLKSDLNPVGLSPGECAGALLLEPTQTSRDRPPWAVIDFCAVDQDAPHDPDDAPPRGRALARTLAPALGGGVIDVHTDLNGEHWRAKEMGTAIVQLGGPALRIHHAASEVGDVGSVSPLLATILAARSIHRGYAKGDRVAVAASSIDGRVGALALSRP